MTANGSRASFPWKWEVIDAGLVERRYCSPDPVLLNAMARELKDRLGGDIRKVDPALFPGLRIFEDVRIGGR